MSIFMLIVGVVVGTLFADGIKKLAVKVWEKIKPKAEA